MKIAISGKGGVGKTTLSAFLCKWFADQGRTVLAIDADPATNLGAALAIPGADSLPPITEMKSLVAERTGTQPGSMGGYFKLNPKVDDLPDKIAISDGNIRLMVMGGPLKNTRSAPYTWQGRGCCNGHGCRLGAPGPWYCPSC
jgi:CO dehydrogenase maturation factor